MSVHASEVPMRQVVARGEGDRTGGGASSGALSAAPSTGAEGEDPDEIDVSDQLEEVDAGDDPDTDDPDTDDPDTSDDLMFADDGDDEDDEETSTSVAIWGTAPEGASPASSAEASPAPSTIDQAAHMNSVPMRQPASASAQLEARDDGDAETDGEDQKLGQPQSSGASLGRGQAHGGGQGLDDPQRDVSALPASLEAAPGDVDDVDAFAPKQTFMADGTKFTGALKSSCPVVINGTFDGEIDAPVLRVASSGAIVGSIRAHSLHSSGMLAGEVDASEAYVAGAVRSNTIIRARRLELKINAPVRSRLLLTFGVGVDANEPPGAADDGEGSGAMSESDESIHAARSDLPEPG